jgi:hypothetical protein
MSITTKKFAFTTTNANSTDAADAVAQALTGMKFAGLKNDLTADNKTANKVTKANINIDSAIFNDHGKLAVNDNYSLWMDNNTGTMYTAIDMVDKDAMNRYVDNSEFLIFRKWSTDSLWEPPGCWLAENVKEVVEENKWTVTGTTNGMYINNFHSLPATIRIYAILDMVIVEYSNKSYRFRYMKCDKDTFKTEFDKTIRKLITKIIEFTEKSVKMTDNFNKSLDIMMQGSEFET